MNDDFSEIYYEMGIFPSRPLTCTLPDYNVCDVLLAHCMLS